MHEWIFNLSFVKQLRNVLFFEQDVLIGRRRKTEQTEITEQRNQNVSRLRLFRYFRLFRISLS
jgi:hypothetical protein